MSISSITAPLQEDSSCQGGPPLGLVAYSNFMSFLAENPYPEKLSLVLHLLPENRWPPCPVLESCDLFSKSNSGKPSLEESKCVPVSLHTYVMLSFLSRFRVTMLSWAVCAQYFLNK